MFFIILFYIVPNIYSFIFSFTDWNTFKTEINFIGLKNFRHLIKEGVIWEDLFTTFKFAGMALIAEIGVAFILALALEKKKFINSFFRSVFFIPVLISSLATGYIFKGLFDGNGSVNTLISFITNTDFNFEWFGSLTASLVIVSIGHAWKWFGVSMTVFIAGLNSVTNELIEAAKIEGASYLQIVKNIKIPLIIPAFTFSVTTVFIGAFSAFDIALAMTKGGPARATELLNLFIWIKYGTGRFGYATAISLILFLIIIVLAIIIVTYFRRKEIEV